jgi:dihydropteroate synthase
LEHNLDLIAHLDTLASGLRPLLLGVSRKSFLGQALGVDLADRLPGGLACTVWAALQGVQVFRTHDVAATVQALRMVEALSSVRSRSA